MRNLRTETHKKLLNYLIEVERAGRLEPKLIALLEKLSANDAAIVKCRKTTNLYIAQNFSPDELAKLLSRMSSYLNRKLTSKVSVELKSDTKELIDRKMAELNYDSIDELIFDAVQDYKL